MTVLTPRPTAAPADAPTAVLRPGAVLHRVRSAAAAVWRLSPGRYLAIPDGDEVIVARLGLLTRIGRRPGADVVLDDTTVSRRHALVMERDGESIIADDRSRNGLFVNGRRVLQAPLHNGDEIQLGALVMRFLEVQPTPR
jgi:pSer/pThr/pTyr-binding forkhead associated (FHA) protein